MGVNGSESRSQRAVSVAGRLKRLRPRALAAPRAAAQQRDLQQQELVEREPAPAALLVAEVRGVERRRSGPGSRSSARMRAGSGSSTSRIVRAVLVHERGDLHAT